MDVIIVKENASDKETKGKMKKTTNSIDNENDIKTDKNSKENFLIVKGKALDGPTSTSYDVNNNKSKEKMFLKHLSLLIWKIIMMKM